MIRKKIKFILTVTLLVVVAIVSFYIGKGTGFSRGYLVAWGSDAPADAANILSAINQLRNIRAEAAIDLLESEIDTKIVKHWKLMESRPEISQRENQSGYYYGFSDVSVSLMRTVAQYRSDYPYPNPDKGMSKSVDSAVKYYVSQ
ncbi:MAG: hypothetical protein K8S27_09770 [Candidatus Omnitrophica bacterium]|nr:hypothetical protein [Candidatus Omnitrophota bacterium]